MHLHSDGRAEGPYPGGGWVHEPLGMSKYGDCAGLLHTETKVKVLYQSDPAYKGF